MADGSVKDEYAHASENIRHYQTIRFSLLTVFMAICAGILTVFAATAAKSPGALTLILKLAGLGTTFLFWILQERTMLFWNHFVRRAAELESTLNYQQYSARPEARIITSNNAIRLFFLIIVVFSGAMMIWAP